MMSMMWILAAADPAAEHAPSLFAGSIWQSLAAILAFLILLAILGKYAWGPIVDALQNRENRIRQDIEEAERASREASTTLAQYKQQLAEAQKESQRIIEASKTDAQRVATQIKEQAQADIQQMRQRAENDIRVAKEQALGEIYEQTATLATKVAAQILKREMQPQDHQALVRESLNELAKQN